MYQSVILQELDLWAYTIEYTLINGEFNNRSKLQRQLIVIKKVMQGIYEKQLKEYGKDISWQCQARVFKQNPLTQELNPIHVEKRIPFPKGERRY